jgi:hypothetical protein
LKALLDIYQSSMHHLLVQNFRTDDSIKAHFKNQASDI